MSGLKIINRLSTGARKAHFALNQLWIVCPDGHLETTLPRLYQPQEGPTLRPGTRVESTRPENPENAYVAVRLRGMQRREYQLPAISNTRNLAKFPTRHSIQHLSRYCKHRFNPVPQNALPILSPSSFGMSRARWLFYILIKIGLCTTKRWEQRTLRLQRIQDY